MTTRPLDAEVARLEFAGVLLRLAQGHALALHDRGFGWDAVRAIIAGALWRACMDGLSEAAANDAHPFPLECEDAD